MRSTSTDRPGSGVAGAGPTVPSRATIREVARHAGVSVTTVSHTLSGKRAVAESTRTRVLAAVDELGYRPNAAATSLRTGLASAIALIVPDIANPFFAELARGVEDAAHDRGWSVFLCNTALRPEREADYIERCLAGGVDGVVYCSTETASVDVQRVRDEVADRMPVVVCDERIPGMGGGVFSDNRGGGHLAGAHLAGLGRRRPVAIGGPSGLPTAHERVDGFRAGLAEADIELPDTSVRWTGYRMDDGAAAMSALLDAVPDLDAVFTGDDLQALGALRTLQQRGRTVPDDVAVCGFDDIDLASMVSPALTTIRQQVHELGSIAAGMLLGHVLDDDDLDEVTLPVELVVRSTT